MKKFLLVLPLALLLMAFRPMQVPQPPDFGGFIQAVVVAFLALAALPGFVGGVVALLAKFTALSASALQWVSFGINAVVFGVVAYAVFAGNSALLSGLDGALAGAAKLIADILLIVGGFGGALHNSAYLARKFSGIGSHYAAIRAPVPAGKK